MTLPNRYNTPSMVNDTIGIRIPWNPLDHEQSFTKTLKDTACRAPEALTCGIAVPPSTFIDIDDLFQKQIHTVHWDHLIFPPTLATPPIHPPHSTLRGWAKIFSNQLPHSPNNKRRSCCKNLNDHCNLWNY